MLTSEKMENCLIYCGCIKVALTKAKDIGKPRLEVVISLYRTNY